MKVGEFLSKCNKEEIPFYLYEGNKGYKISCLNCDFFNKNKQGIYQCTSLFYHNCQNEFSEWLIRKDMPNEY